MTKEPSAQQPATTADSAVAEGGAYELIRKRLEDQAARLRAKTQALNDTRTKTFGGLQTEVVGGVRVRTENNCVPRDIVSVGDVLLFGYNVFLGMRSETNVSDVFSLHRLVESGGSYEVEDLSLSGTFLDDPVFVRSFKELYQYYKSARLLQLRHLTGKLLAIFLVGDTLRDIKVFRWRVDVEGNVSYIDDRGERDHVFPKRHDFEWVETTREMHVLGRHPHIAIDDLLFVETVGGDLTIKVENNTEDGLGIYREPVDDRTQSLADARIFYAKVGVCYLLKILPYNESAWRYLVFNTRNQQVDRIDAIGASCVQLPEDHGLIYPGGYYLRSGETKSFDGDFSSLYFKRQIKSPNGEDVLYVFDDVEEGRYVLFTYNMIRKELAPPIGCHGYSLFDDGLLVVFRADSLEPTRNHNMQLWRTPFQSDSVAAKMPTDGSYLAKIGNAELVRGISDAYSICRMIDNQSPSMAIYEDLIAATTRVLDAYHWFKHADAGDIASTIKEVRQTAELVIDEFEKVQAIQQRANEALTEAETAQRDLSRTLRPDSWERIDQFVDALASLRKQRGRLITMRDMRYVDLGRIDEMEAQVAEQVALISERTVAFLLRDDALVPYLSEIESQTASIDTLTKVIEFKPMREALDTVGAGLDLLTEIVGNLKIEDATVRTRILENISEVFAQLNRSKALLENRRKSLMSTEAVAEFGAEFMLFSQSVQSALAMCDTPEKADEQLSRILVQLEELEGRFSEFDQFVGELAQKREEVHDAFEARKQTLLEERQRRANTLATAADRILGGIARRALAFRDVTDLHAYFAADAMVLKVRDVVEKLRQLGESVRADDVEARLKSSRDQAIRALRDKLEIFDEGGAVIKLGRHRFSVNTQPLDLTLLPRDETLVAHLTGTDFFEPLEDGELSQLREFWEQEVLSETRAVYRGEYLAASLLFAAANGSDGASLGALREAARDDGLLALVRRAIETRYDEGYERGIHDHDAALILERLITLWDSAGLLRFAATPRALARLFWVGSAGVEQELWQRQARSLGQLERIFGQSAARNVLTAELRGAIEAFVEREALPFDPTTFDEAADYLVEQLCVTPLHFVVAEAAGAIVDALLAQLASGADAGQLERDLADLGDETKSAWALARAWVSGFVSRSESWAARATSLVDDATALLLLRAQLPHDRSAAQIHATIEGLLGQHPRLAEQRLSLDLPEFRLRMRRFVDERVSGFRRYRAVRQAVAQRERDRLRLDEFRPRVLTSFVRNRLLNEVYLPLIGDNLAKQMGTLGEQKRTDLMGMLLLISPPGYGKTTLMEYVANRLGLIFMKINCPALGHAVSSLDPEEAPNATARQELNKLNLSLEMGNNVMLYLDDIQHTNPEFLQKFISLCDAQRKIEGVWRGRTRTYDLRGKKFCVIMAGNPYTESGDVFKIPDMLANRADIYNLGDILSGREEVFALSYIENALTSNPVLAPLATREMEDVYKLVRMARGEDVPHSELKHNYSATEVSEIKTVLQKLTRVQSVVLRVNQQYIASASQADAFRNEPPFKLQGSYRNMNKMAEKVVSVMNDAELEALIRDHYVGEAQTLTTGAEENLLKLAELLGAMKPEEQRRWDEVKAAFQRSQRIGGGDADPVTRVVGQLDTLGSQLGGIQQALESSSGVGAHLTALQTTIREAAQIASQEAASRGAAEDNQAAMMASYLKKLHQVVERFSDAEVTMQINNLPTPGLDIVLGQFGQIIEGTLVPLLQTMELKLRSDEAIWQRLGEVSEVIKRLDPKSLGGKLRSHSQTVKPFKGDAPSKGDK